MHVAKCFLTLKGLSFPELQLLFHENNDLVHLFKTAIDLMPTDTHKIVISADKTPTGEHMCRYNAPTIDEVAIVIVGDQFLPRDIILHKRNAQLARIAKTLRCYDALQSICIKISCLSVY